MLKSIQRTRFETRRDVSSLGKVPLVLSDLNQMSPNIEVINDNQLVGMFFGMVRNLFFFLKRGWTKQMRGV